MVLTKWQAIIVEWVNCLNLCKTINCVTELKNGKFFNVLLYEILQNNDTGSCNIPNSGITEFLKKYFPSYSLDSECTQSEDKIEVTYVCSLLVYYCSMIDRRPDFIKPLCENLPINSQFYVKTFLQDLEGRDISRDVLKESILNIQKLSTSPVKSYQASPYVSPQKKSTDAPLLDFFKTPLKKYQLNFDLHKKEIKTLIAQLDLERFEKADLQEELKLQYEKNKDLDKKVAAKHSELSRLRSELLSLESKPPPSSKKSEGKLETKRLRDEISSLEKYIEILHKEQENLQAERDNARTRLQKVEDQYSDLQGKNLHTERHCSKLSEEKQEHLQELCYLRERCEELTTILSEFRQRNSADESYEMDISQSDFLHHNKSGSIDLESLAQTVVDVQLVDAQEENKSLRKQLTELEVNSSDLTSQVSELQTRIEKVLSENTALHASTATLNEKVSILMETQQQLKTTELKLKESSDLKKTLDSAIEDLYTKLATNEIALNESQQQNEQLLIDLRNYTDQNNNLTSELAITTDKYDQILTSKSELETKLNNSIAKCLTFEKENHFINMTLVNFQQDLQICLVELAQEIESTVDLNDQERGIDILKMLISDIRIKNCEHSKHLFDLQQNCATLSANIVKFNTEITRLNADNINLHTTVLSVKDCLEKAEQKVQTFETVTIVNYDQLIDKYTFIIEEKNQVIHELNTEALSRNKHLQISEENKLQLDLKLEDLTEELTKEQHSKLALEEIRNSLEGIIKERDQSIKNLKSEKLNLQSELFDLNTDLEKRIIDLEVLQLQLQDLEQIKQDNEDIINDVKESKSDLEERRQELAKELSDEQNSKAALMQECETLKEEIIEKDNTIIELKKEVVNKSELKYFCNKLEATINDLTQQLSVAQTHKEELEREYKLNTELIIAKDNIIANLNKQLIEAQEQLEQIVIIKDNIITDLNKQLCIAQEEKLESERNVQHITELMNTGDNIITNLNKQLKEMQENKIELEMKHQQLSDIISTKDKTIVDTRKQLQEEQKDKEELEHDYEQIKEIIVAKDVTIADLELEKLNMNKQFEILDCELINTNIFKEEIETKLCEVQNELIDKEAKMIHLEDYNIDLKTQLETLEEELWNNKEIKQELDDVRADMSKTLTSKNEQIQLLQLKITDMNNQTVQLNNKLQGYESDIDNEMKLRNASEKKCLQLQEHYDLLLLNKITTAENYKCEQKMLVEKLQNEIQTVRTHINVINLEMFDSSEDDSTIIIINKLQTHLLQLKQQLELATTEKEEALEESTALAQDLQKIKENYIELQDEIIKKIEELITNLTRQIDIETTDGLINFKELHTLKRLEVNHNSLLRYDKDTLGDFSEIIDKLHTNISGLLLEKIRADSEIISYKDQIVILKKIQNDLETQAINEQDNLNSVCLNYKQDNIILKQKIESYRNEIDVSHASLLDLQDRMTNLSENRQMDIDNYEQKITNLNKQCSDFESEILNFKTLEKDLNIELINIKSQLEQSISDYKSIVNTEEASKHKCEIEIVTLNNKLDHLTKSYAELQRTQSETVLKLEQTINLTEIEKNHSSELEQLISGLHMENSNLNTKLQSQIDQLLNEKEDLKAASIQICSQLQGMKELNQNLKQQITESKNELQEKLEDFNNEKLTLKAEITDLTSKLVIAETEKKHSDLNNNMKLCEVISDHELKLKSSETEIMGLNAKLKETKQLLSDLEISKDVLKQETRSIIQEKENNIEELQLEIQCLKQNLNLILADKSLIQAKLDELTVDLKTLKSFSDENNLKFNAQETEIMDTKDKLAHVLIMVENVTEILQQELENASDKITNETQTLNNSKEHLNNELLIKENITVKIQNEVSNLKQHIADLVYAKSQIEAKLLLINEKYNELVVKKDLEAKSYEIKLDAVQLQHDQNYRLLEQANKEAILQLEQNLMRKDSIVDSKLAEISNLNLRLTQTIQNCERLESEKTQLVENFNRIRLQLVELKQQRNLLSASQQTLRKEMELHILRGHESIDDLKFDFIKRLKMVDDQQTQEINIKKPLEKFINCQQRQIEFLEKRIVDLTNEREQSISLCSESNQHIHKLHSLLIENDKKKMICQRICRLKDRESEIENKLQLLHAEKDLVDEECLQISNKLTELLDKVPKYELIEHNYEALKIKYNLIAVKKVSEYENQLSDLHLENLKCQRELSDTQLVQKEDIMKKNKLDEEVAFMKKACETKNEELLKQEKELKRVQHSNLSLQNLIVNFEHKIIDFEKLIQQKDGDTEELNKHIKELQRKLDGNQQKSKKHLQMYEDCQIMNKVLSKKHEDLSEQHQQLIEKSNQAHIKELTKLSQLKADKSQLQIEFAVVRQSLDDCNAQMMELSLVKDKSNKLFEENNKNKIELDTLRYNKRRDKEEYKRLLLEEQSNANEKCNVHIQELRNEYEEKLKKMKEQMAKMYKEELNKKDKKRQRDHEQLEEKIACLKSQQEITANKYLEMKIGNEKLLEKIKRMQSQSQNYNRLEVSRYDIQGSRESINSLREPRCMNRNRNDERRVNTLPNEKRSSSATNMLPPAPNITEIEESVTFSRRTSIAAVTDHGLRMEDEQGEVFSNLNLADLMVGRCEPMASNDSRLSELQYRNSLCMPHLKSSYPIETQFVSPGQFKEDDVKAITVDLDDSMSSSLLPGQKPRMRKDRGQTMYKKPGPPTPSKNGGRLSLQGNEMHPRDILREQNENLRAVDPRVGKSVSTPSRIKALFTRSSTSNNTEVNNNIHHQRRFNTCHHSLVPLLRHQRASQPAQNAILTRPLNNFRGDPITIKYTIAAPLFMLLLGILIPILYPLLNLN